MQDKELRGLVLQRLYDIRHTKDVANPSDFADLGLEQNVLGNILEQLAQEALVDWKPLRGGMRTYLAFMAHITVHGSQVIEGVEQSNLEIKIDKSINVHGSTNVQIGQGNIQTINLDAEKIVANINSANASNTEKEEAKSLLKKLMDNPLLKGALELWARSHTGGA